jgi:hypothetical protein
MVRTTCLVAALVAIPIVAEAQQPCTRDAQVVVNEIYQRILERPFDEGGHGWVTNLRNGRDSVRDLVASITKSPEYAQKFLSGDPKSGVTNLYRHLLGRTPDIGGLADNSEAAAKAGWNAVIDSMVRSSEYTRFAGNHGVPGTNVRYCGTATSPFRTSQSNQTRFPGQDRNNDGMITRGEWTGTRAVFDRNDWNRDGVLAGEEIEVGADRSFGPFDRTTATFNTLDRNRDNRVSASEWRYDTDSFVRADRNGDDVLTRAEFLAEDSPSPFFDNEEDDRFNSLDLNGNGRIERSEWRASADAFSWLDRDGNGFLNRAEVIGPQAAREQFTAFDVDGDDRLSVREWPYSRQSFTQHDTNGDGLLTRQEFLRSSDTFR